MLHPCRGKQAATPKLQSTRLLVAPSGKASQGWEVGASLLQHNPLSTQLKALVKSSLTRTLSAQPLRRRTQALTVWMAFSAPPGTATPTWAGQKKDRASCRTKAIRHLPVSRRKNSPTWMGRTPPPGLGSATGAAPATGATAPGTCPCAKRLITAVSCVRKLSPPPATLASRRC